MSENNNTEKRVQATEVIQPRPRPQPQPRAWQNKVKQWSSVSIKGFIIWCVGFFIFTVLIAIWALYWAINNPETLWAVWLELETVKNLLKVFAILFYWILFFFSFYLLASNLYKLFTHKSWKAKYAIWWFIGFSILITTMVLWTISFISINRLSWEKQIVTNSLINPYIMIKDNEPVLYWDLPLIAPSYLRFQLNQQMFDNNVLSVVWNLGNVVWLTLDCWNWQLINAWPSIFWSNWFFPWDCLFLRKDNYQLRLITTYFDRQTNSNKEITSNVLNLNFISEIWLTSNWSSYSLNQARNEILVWAAPSSIRFDATSLFTDLRLADQNIEWDLTWDWAIDQVNNSIINFTYRNPKLNVVYYRLPDLSDKFYSFSFRTQESSVPACNVNVSNRSWSRYEISASAPWSMEVRSYSIEIYNLDANRVHLTRNSRNWQIVEDLLEWTNFIIHVKYETTDWEVWNCSSDDFLSWVDSFDIEYKLRFKRWSDANFSDASLNSDWELIIDLIPTKLELEIISVDPKFWSNYNANVSFNWDNFLPLWNNKFDYEIRSQDWRYNISIVLEDPRWNKINESIPVIVEQKELLPMLLLINSDWEEPLEVTLDASASRVTVEGDSIIYYSWDFWDWNQLPNSNQWQVSHVYHFDTRRQDGTYTPCVTIRTRWWLSEKVCKTVFVHREQKQANITIPTHPTQSARVGDRVEFNVNTDWTVKSISWDFWDWKTVSWEWRTLATVPKIYDESWDYRIRVVVEYDDNPRVVWNITIRVRE